MKTDLEAVSRAASEWQEEVVGPKLGKLKVPESPTRFYSPQDLQDFDFLESVGFPGQYPFTAGNDPIPTWQAKARQMAMAGYRYEWGASGSGKYGGFGAPEDYRDYLLRMHGLGRKGGPNIAFDLPTQCGYDSDSPWAEGEVGRVGVALDTFRDFEVIYEAYTGGLDIDKVPSNFTINAPAAVIIAMYVALAEKRGVPLDKLRGTPQNDILKEFVSRGAYILPPEPSMRLFRDTLVFCTEHLPNFNITSIGGYHMREAGASREQDLAFSMANGAAYLQAGVDAGLPVDSFAHRFTFNAFGGSMEIFQEVAFQRAARRMWAGMLRERFGAKNPRSMMIRQIATAHVGCTSTTLQRPLNNLIRAVVGALAGAMSGGVPLAFPPYDEPLGLGHSLEAQQLAHDATRILIYEAKVGEVVDPWCGSYFMESLTNEIEEAARLELEKIEKMGGAVAAVDNGYMHRAIAKSAYERQKRLETREEFQVGVNCFDGPHELELSTGRTVPEVYDAELLNSAEERQKATLKQVKRERHERETARALNELHRRARDGYANLLPEILDCVKSYATLQEICDVLREVFGEAKPATG
ncbi:MAG: methylmalonyl-CoA mutase family protein [Desulfomonilaceae bacterium]|nr:methylmalonyl-CoA mutase family protein [Desulfomonilaceae bacterium]